jgi:hypothetical protein
MPSLNLDSNMAMAARDPEPIVANGSVSVDPCGYTCIIIIVIIIPIVFE